MTTTAPKRIFFDENGAFASPVKGYPEEIEYIRADLAKEWLWVLRKAVCPLAWFAEKHPEFQKIYDEVNDAIEKATDF